MSLIRTLIFFLLILLPARMMAQSYFFINNGNYRYFVGHTEPDSSWKNSGFIDSLWLQGNQSIGYGHGIDSTHIEPTTSLYLRIHFDVSNKSAVKDANLMVDFDDGFVAYLNGVEIARTNLGKTGEYIAHDRLTDRSHEAYFYRNYFRPLCGYYISGTKLATSLNNGSNVLAIQVQNDSLNGSDLFFNSRFIDLTNAYYNLWADESRYRGQVVLDSTKLPIVVINTDAWELPRDHVPYVAQMGIINNGKGRMNKPGDPFTDYNGRITIEIRGESTKDFPKKCYNIVTQDDAGNDFNVPLLGMPAENDWILYGPFADKSLIRNEFAFFLARKMGDYEPRARYCEVLMNGELHGLYMFMEKIKRDKNRVNVAKLEQKDSSGIALTGGYVVKYDKPVTGMLQYVSPTKNNILDVQKTYINSFFNEYYSVLGDSRFMNDSLGYKKYMDPASLIDYSLATELMKNADGYIYSTFLSKDRDDRDSRIKYGPLWDNDLAFGGTIFQDGYKTYGWQFDYNQNLQITKVMRDTAVTHQYARKWKNLRKGLLRTDSLMFYIDSLSAYITDARIRNYKVWPVIDKTLFYPYYNTYSYPEEINTLKNWLQQRVSWMDGNISLIYYRMPQYTAVPGYQAEESDLFIVYPNPFTKELMLRGNLYSRGIYTVEITDMVGKRVYLSNKLMLEPGWFQLVLGVDNMESLPRGIYLLTVRKEGRLTYQQKVIKL